VCVCVCGRIRLVAYLDIGLFNKWNTNYLFEKKRNGNVIAMG